MCGDVAKWYADTHIVIRIVYIQKWLGSEVLVYTYLYLYINMRNINNVDLSNIQLKMSE